MNEEIDIKKDLYLCCPLLNKECKKDTCYIHNGDCKLTTNKEYSQQELIDRIDKAIEYLKLFDENSNLIDHSVIKGALTILKGSDTNVKD